MAKIVTKEIFLERINQRNDVEYISGFIDTHTKVRLKCTICGYDEWYTTPHDLFRPRFCPKCGNKKRSNYLNKPVKNYLNNLLKNLDDPNEYTWLEEYKKDNKKLHWIRHNNCGNEYQVRPNDFQQGYRCPKCSKKESKVCQKITKLLEDNNIEFYKEVYFDEFKANQGLHYKFDFLIKDTLLIEIDGFQHFDNNSKWNHNSVNRKRDLIKNNFIKENNKYRLLRIPYLDKKNIPEILFIFESMIKNDFRNITYLAKKYNLMYIYLAKNKKDLKILNEESYYKINDERCN